MQLWIYLGRRRLQPFVGSQGDFEVAETAAGLRTNGLPPSRNAYESSRRGKTFPVGQAIADHSCLFLSTATRLSKRAVFSKNTASVLADWKSPNKQSPHRHGDAQRGVSDPRMCRSPSSLRFATHTFEALRPLCVLADHPFLFARECLGIGHVALHTHVMVTRFLTGGFTLVQRHSESPARLLC